MATKPSLIELQTYPTMTRWFNPALLSKLLLRVIVSDVFGQYADRRLLEAALDPASAADLVSRADITNTIITDQQGAAWIDFVADLGDGFDATYAIASLLSQDRVTIEDHSLPRGGALFMGGDEVYPTANRADYHKRMLKPYALAFPDRAVARHPHALVIPGNHDWYDGLVTFLAIFCREKPTRIGNWRTKQRRSYFAAKVTDLCWVWAIDFALVADMDQPQADYFVAIARSMPQNANVILCSAEPGWYKSEGGSYRTLSYAAWIAENAGKSLKIPLVLSGDTHHYSHYSSDQGAQYITSGGGGALLHGTHQLQDSITVNWLRYAKSVLSLQKCWPSKEQSKGLLKGNFAFPLLNWDFSILLGSLYLLSAFLLSELPRGDVAFIVLAILAAGFISYSGYQDGWTRKVVTFSFFHSLTHWIAILALTCAFVWLDSKLFQFHLGPWWAWLVALGILMVPIGGAIAGLIFGMNLMVTCRWANMNHNDAFSAMRLDGYRHFLRIKIVGDSITVYPIGISQIPTRGEWKENPDHANDPNAPVFVPLTPLTPELIEKPIVISGFGVAPTTDLRTPSELPPTKLN